MSSRVNSHWWRDELSTRSHVLCMLLSGVSEQPLLLLRGDMFFVSASDQPRTYAEVRKGALELHPASRCADLSTSSLLLRRHMFYVSASDQPPADPEVRNPAHCVSGI